MSSDKSIKNKITPKEKKLLLFIFFYYFVLGGLFLVSFRLLRDILPFPKIGSEGIVGYSQYYGYPSFLDTAIFMLFFLSPFGILLLNRLTKKG